MYLTGTPMTIAGTPYDWLTIAPFVPPPLRTDS
jgi:hypothetical protein